jgi:hypothetical protein
MSEDDDLKTEQQDNQTPATKGWTERLRNWVPAVSVGALVGAYGLGYTLGKDNGSAAVETAKANGEKELTKCERAIAAKEEDVRQCTTANAQLQVFAKLAESEKSRLLDLTATQPQLKVSSRHKPLKGEVHLAAMGGSDGGCFEFPVEFENTGTRDVVPAYMDLFSPIALTSSEASSVQEPNGFRMPLAWGGLLAPGARSALRYDLCGPGWKAGQEVTVTIAIYSSGFLPISNVVTFKLEQPVATK